MWRFGDETLNPGLTRTNRQWTTTLSHQYDGRRTFRNLFSLFYVCVKKSCTEGKLPPPPVAGSIVSTAATEDHRLLWNTKTVCEALGGIHPRTLARMEKDGLVCGVKLLRHRLYARKDIESFVEGLRAWRP